MQSTIQRSTFMSLTTWTGKFSTVVIAHRGFSGVAPENTLTAFSKAIETGCDMLELDVQLTRDGEIVVIHDSTLDRTTSGKGRVNEHTLQELKQLEITSSLGNQGEGERIPMLKEVFTLTRDRIPLMIELKKGNTHPSALYHLADRAFAQAEEAGCLDQVVFSSFERTVIERMLEKNPQVPVAYIVNWPWHLSTELTARHPVPILNCHHSILSQDRIAKAHQAGLKINVWTIDKESEMERLLDLGVDGIITNYPDRAINILRQRQRTEEIPRS